MTKTSTGTEAVITEFFDKSAHMLETHYENHFKTIRDVYDRALENNNFDSLIIYSGEIKQKSGQALIKKKKKWTGTLEKGFNVVMDEV